MKERVNIWKLKQLVSDLEFRLNLKWYRTEKERKNLLDKYYEAIEKLNSLVF